MKKTLKTEGWKAQLRLHGSALAGSLEHATFLSVTVDALNTINYPATQLNTWAEISAGTSCNWHIVVLLG